MKTEPPPAELGIAQINTLRAAQAFLRDPLKGEVNHDPERLFCGVSRALGQTGTDRQILTQAGLERMTASERLKKEDGPHRQKIRD